MSEQRIASKLRIVVAALLASGVGLGSATVAVADEELPTQPPETPDETVTMNDFVIAPDADDFIMRVDAEDFIFRLGGGQYEDRDSAEESVIVLETDILFRSNEWELPSTADDLIGELVEEVPDGVSVEVHGHTDSLPVDESQFDFDNQELSENRAQAVAEVLADERSDLSLNVEGFGDSQPAVDEDPEDPSTFAANRRVEIRYGD